MAVEPPGNHRQLSRKRFRILDFPGTECSLGQVYKECGIKCAQMCHIYLKQIQKIEAQCLYDQECEDGCVSENLKTCPSGMFLQDESTCVRKQDCMCASHLGVPHRVISQYIILYQF